MWDWSEKAVVGWLKKYFCCFATLTIKNIENYPYLGHFLFFIPMITETAFSQLIKKCRYFPENVAWINVFNHLLTARPFLHKQFPWQHKVILVSVSTSVHAEFLYLCPAFDWHWGPWSKNVKIYVHVLLIIISFIHGLALCCAQGLCACPPGFDVFLLHFTTRQMLQTFVVFMCMFSLLLTCWRCNTDRFHPIWQSNLLAVYPVCCEAEATGTLQIGSAGLTLRSCWRIECVEVKLRAVHRRSCVGILLCHGLFCGDTNRSWRKAKTIFSQNPCTSLITYLFIILWQMLHLSHLYLKSQ